MDHGAVQKKRNRIITKLITVLILILVFCAFGKLFADKRRPTFIFNHASFIVISSSMEPEYPVNSIVIIKKEPFVNLGVGDVIAYESDALGGKLAFHRITRITNDGIYVKGEKNTYEDNQLITKSTYVGKGVSRITFLAKYFSSIRTVAGFVMFFILPLIAIVLLTKSLKVIFVKTTDNKINFPESKNTVSCTKNTKNTMLSVALTAFFAFHSIFGGLMFGSYSDITHTTGSIETGNVKVAIEDLQMEHNETIWTEEDQSINFGMLNINESVTLSFAVKNLGRSGIEYSLDFEIAWRDELPESGKLFVYPDELSDEIIYQNIQENNFQDAIIAVDSSDMKEITLSDKTAKGFSETVDFDALDISTEEENNLPSKDYRLKLFLYEDDDITANTDLYHNKDIEVNLIVRAGLKNKQTKWSATEKKNIKVTTVIDLVYPIITEVNGPKTFFISQAAGIDLKDYAVASDINEGDITPRITISSFPEFDPQQAGVYTITYNVKNSSGKAAVALHIAITVWDFVKTESGYYHTLALSSHGKVYAWGYNGFGQLGDGTNTDRSVAKQVENLPYIIDVAAGTGVSYALSVEGQVYSWGRNENGRLGDNTTVGKNRPVKALQPYGIVFKQISARFASAGAVTEDGDVYTWGYGGYGTLGNGKTTDIHVPTKINLSNIASVEIGYYNGAAITKDGKCYTWGDNLNGQLGKESAMAAGANAPAIVPYFENRQISVKDISVGWYHMAAVSTDGKLFTWGYGAEGRLGNGATSSKNVPQPVELSGLVKKAVAGYSHTGVLTEEGIAYFFGQNLYGKHGSGNETNHLTPYKLESVDKITYISLGIDSSFVLSNSTTVFGMGYGGTGVLGTGNNSNSNVAVKWAFMPPAPSVYKIK